MKSKLVYSDEIPKIFPELQARFGVKWEDGIIIAYEGKIHSKEVPEAQKWIHEEVHLKRQAEIGNEIWWKSFIESDQFRLEEEVLAYRAEVSFLKKNIKNREVIFHMTRELALALSSDIYGNIISPQDALKMLR